MQQITLPRGEGESLADNSLLVEALPEVNNDCGEGGNNVRVIDFCLDVIAG